MKYFPNCALRALAAVAIVAIVGFASSASAGLVKVSANGSAVSSSNAAVATVQGSPSAPLTPTGSGISTINLAGKVGAASGFVLNGGSNQVTVSYANGGGVVQGSKSGYYAAPVINASGATVTAPYLSTNTTSGGAGGSYTFVFSALQSYLGLLWGSIGNGDTLTFFNGSTQVGMVKGPDAQAAGINFNNANGAQNYGGSQFTLINFLNGIQFNKVVFGQTLTASLEAANFQYAAIYVGVVPEPASFLLLGIGLAGLVVSRRRCRV